MVSIDRRVNGESLWMLGDGRDISRITLWIHRLVTVVFFGAWARTFVVWPDQAAILAIVPISLGVLWYFGILRLLSSPKADESDRDTATVGSRTVMLLPAHRRISTGRLWGARVTLLIVALFALGFQAAASPTQFLNIAATPILSLILVFAVVSVYVLALLALSSTEDSGEAKETNDEKTTA